MNRPRVKEKAERWLVVEEVGEARRCYKEDSGAMHRWSEDEPGATRRRSVHWWSED